MNARESEVEALPHACRCGAELPRNHARTGPGRWTCARCLRAAGVASRRAFEVSALPVCRACSRPILAAESIAGTPAAPETWHHATCAAPSPTCEVCGERSATVADRHGLAACSPCARSLPPWEERPMRHPPAHQFGLFDLDLEAHRAR